MIKAVLFDLDNTLIDFMKVKRSSVDAAISAMIGAGVKVKKAEATKTLYELYNTYGIEYQHIFQKFLQKVMGKVDYKVLAEGIVAYRKTQAGIREPYADVIPTLIMLKQQGMKLAIVSDAPRLKAWLRLVEMRLQDFFDVVITFEDTRKLKHTGAPFRKALKLLKLKPEECLMIGDWPERDVVGSKKVGIRTAFAKYGATRPVKKSGADFELDSISDVNRIVSKLNA